SLVGQWEVALSEIAFPSTWFTIPKGDGQFSISCVRCWINANGTLKEDQLAFTLSVPPGYYESVTQFYYYSVLFGFFRSAMPLLRRGLSFLGKQALRTWARIATDVAEGQDVTEAAKRRVTETINEHIPGIIPQSGSGKRRRKTKRLRPNSFIL